MSDKLLRLPSCALRCYVALLTYERAGSEVRVRRADLAKRLGRAPRTISDGLAALVAAGFLARLKRGRYIVKKIGKP
jgi:predicted transcriptional regulator